MRPPLKGDVAEAYNAAMCGASNVWSGMELGLSQGSTPLGDAMDELLRRVRVCLPWVPRKRSPVRVNAHEWWTPQLDLLRGAFRSTWRAFERGRVGQAEARAARLKYRQHVHWAKKCWRQQQQVRWLEVYFSSCKLFAFNTGPIEGNGRIYTIELHGERSDGRSI